MAIELDSYDRKLLAEVQRDARIAQNELGARVNLSTAAVNRRRKRLTEEKVIQKYTAVVAPEALGYTLSIIANVEAESEQIDLLDAMKRSFEQCPQVQQCYYVAGEWDFVLVFAVTPHGAVQRIDAAEFLFQQQCEALQNPGRDEPRQGRA